MGCLGNWHDRMLYAHLRHHLYGGRHQNRHCVIMRHRHVRHCHKRHCYMRHCHVRHAGCHLRHSRPVPRRRACRLLLFPNVIHSFSAGWLHQLQRIRMFIAHNRQYLLIPVSLRPIFKIIKLENLIKINKL